MKKNRKKLLVVVAVAIFMLALSSTGFAAYFETNLKAAYRNITVYRNNKQVQFSHEPFIVDGTTYVPLRDMSEILGKEVTWNGATYEIGINDTAGENAELYNQILTLQGQVSHLQNENKKLKDQLEEEKVVDLDDLEDDLNDEYEDEFRRENLYFDFRLKGNEKSVKVTIKAVDKNDKSVDYIFDYISESKLESFLEEMYDYIRDFDGYEGAKITGSVQDYYEDIDFEFDKRGNVELDW